MSAVLPGPPGALADVTQSFAFVEYEDRRDADDAYHEMHNKRIGRDDILKIEVGCPIRPAYCSRQGEGSTNGIATV